MTFQSADAAPATGERNKVDEGANADRALKAAEPHQSQDGAAAGAGVNWPANAAGLPKRAASARGLFRATGKTSKPVAVRDLSGEIVKADALEREKDDFYPTPPEPTRAFLAVEGDRLRDFPCIWEPACGDGAMVSEMEAVGLRVQKTDLIDRGCGAMIADFYSFSAGPRAIVTNPPFAECNKDPGWVRHAMERIGVEYMALLMNWGFPGAGGLGPFWAKHPPARVYLMRWKIDFTGQGAPPMLNAWFVWDKQHKGETVLRMLDRIDARQSSLFAGAA